MNATTSQKISGQRGEILVSEAAIAAVVRGALGEVEGVHGVEPLAQEGGVLSAWSKATREHSDITITSQEDGSLHVKLRLIVSYGVKLDDVAKSAIRTVRERVLELAGVEIGQFEVEIKGLRHPSPPPAVSQPQSR